jgi:hypothetical protein
MFVPHRKHVWASTAWYGDSFTILFTDDVHTSYETHVWASAASYGYSVTFLCIDDDRTSQKTHVWASTACYGDRFIYSLLLFILISSDSNNHE